MLFQKALLSVLVHLGGLSSSFYLLKVSLKPWSPLHQLQLLALYLYPILSWWTSRYLAHTTNPPRVSLHSPAYVASLLFSSFCSQGTISMWKDQLHSHISLWFNHWLLCTGCRISLPFLVLTQIDKMAVIELRVVKVCKLLQKSYHQKVAFPATVIGKPGQCYLVA